MKWMIIACFAALVASPLCANEILVSVGQQADATRLVLTFETRPVWSAEGSDRMLNLAFDPKAENIELSVDESFLIGSRIDTILFNEDSNILSVELSCECSTQVYPHGAGSLIVDVREKFRVAEVEGIVPVAPTQPRLHPENESSNPIETPKDLPIRGETPNALYADDINDDIPVFSQPSFEPADIELGIVETLGFSIRSDNDSQAVEFLSRELSRAAAQGLVEPGPDASQIRPTKPVVAEASSLADRSNIAVVTSLDRDILASRSSGSPTDLGAVCFPDRDVDLTNWGDTTDISTLGQLRRDAFAENGDVKPEGAHVIARYYIALGFGAEAASASFFMNDGKQKQLVKALAQIVDHGFSDIPIFDGQIFCDGKVALWAALARPIQLDGPPVSTDRILATFSALPPHLRAHLGPVLAERLREVGLENEARNAVNAVARGGLQSNESELVTARMALEGTRPDNARDTLLDISTGTDVTAAEALLELLLDAERRQMAPNPSWVEDAPSLARATEGTDIAAKLNIAGLRGRIALGQFDLLRLAIAEDTPGLDRETRSKLAVSGLMAATQSADASVFLRAEVGLSKLLEVSEMKRVDRYSVAKRLLSIGLAERAERYLASVPESIDELETVASVLTETGQAELAVNILSNRDGNATASKLGDVLSVIGQTQDAIEAYERGGSLDEAARAAMRSGDWQWIAERQVGGKSGALSEIARLLIDRGETTEESGIPQNGELILTSRELRKQAVALLSETNVTDASSFTN